ncbi:hypothetical protein [Cumulibacter manganitolerans]|uniref:hypothetical protein n=1 Tax=Cumulibacter manganitolerans TaxID=1884992 RepID=UPI001296F5FD|nr:hypothetical protein [Cumulibacter manganitolerans]
MAANDVPLWRQAFNKAERAVGEPMEKAIDTRQFADAMSLGAKVSRGVRRQIYGTVNRTLHFVGLSTLKDTRDISRQLGRVHAQLREVITQLEYLEERERGRETGEPGTAPPSVTKSAPARKTAPVKTAAPPRRTAPARKTTPAKKSAAPATNARTPRAVDGEGE